MTKKVTHTHCFEDWAATGPSSAPIVVERCRCGVERERPATCSEKAMLRRSSKRSTDVHHLWHPIAKALEPERAGWKCPHCKCIASPERAEMRGCWICKRPANEMVWFDGYAGLQGFEAMEWMEKYAKKHKEILYCHCDDDVFSNSDVWLVPHFCGKKSLGRSWMGVTILYIPQCTGERPTNFFLYPGDDQKMSKALAQMIRFRNTFPKEGRNA